MLRLSCLQYHSIILMFSIVHYYHYTDLPEALKDTGFPNGLVAGMSLPGSK